MKNIATRSLFGLLYIVLVLGGLFFSKYSFLALITLFAILSIIEFGRLTEKWLNRFHISLLYIEILTGIILSFLVNFRILNPDWLLLTILPALIVLLANLYHNSENNLINTGVFFLGTTYLMLPFMLAFRLASVNGEYTYQLMLGLFLLLWSNDTFAYIFGSLLGKHKLLEKISPKKTWEGFLGGAMATLIIAFFIAKWLNIITPFAWVLTGLLISIFGTFGDLLESAMKRQNNMKDSGSIIPGHGGILDRIDSFLISLPVVTILLLLIFNLN